MTDDFYLDRPSQAALVELLEQIPGLVEDLTIAITRQDRFSTGMRIRRGSDEQPLPLNGYASDAARDLHSELSRWVRMVVEQRQLDYTGPDATISLAWWLKRWIIALALTPGSEEAVDDIQHAMRKARAAVDRPREKGSEGRPPGENLEAVPLTKRELREAIYVRTGKRVLRQTLDRWISRNKLTACSPGYYMLDDALAVMTKTEAA